MSPTITWRNGGPLMVGGLVGGSERCCCENPPPPFCYWPDHCSYLLEVLTPVGLASKSPPLSCDDPVGVRQEIVTQQDWLFDGIEYDPNWISLESLPPTVSVSAVPGHEIQVGFRAIFWNPDSTLPPGTIGPTSDYIVVSGGVLLRIVSAAGFFGTPVGPLLLVEMRVVASKSNPNNVLCGAYIASYFKRVTFAPDVFCKYDTARSCGPPVGVQIPPSGFRYLPTPIDVNASRASVTATGNPPSAGEFVSGSELEPVESFSTSPDICLPEAAQQVKDFVQSLADALSATFRITSRPRCVDPKPCDCTVPLTGLRLVGPIGVFTIGNTFELETTSDGYTTVIDARPIGGFGNDDYSVSETTYDEEDRVIRTLKYDHYCELSDGVPTWFALIRNACFTYEPEITYREHAWLGRYKCYEQGCDDTEAGRVIGDPIPLYELQDVEFLGDWNPPTGDPPCTPPQYTNETGVNVTLPWSIEQSQPNC